MNTLKTIGVALVTAVVAVLGFGVAKDNLGYGVTPGISMFPASVTSIVKCATPNKCMIMPLILALLHDKIELVNLRYRKH